MVMIVYGRFAAGGVGGSRSALVLCFAVMVVDGYDLVIYGVVLPSLLKYEPWGMTPQIGGAIGTYALLGLLLGALTSGVLGDRFGRRRPIIALVVIFSVLTAACAGATSVYVFGVLRFLVGLALGGVLPLIVSLILEHAPADRRNFFATVTQAGYPVGAILMTLSGIVVIEQSGFRTLFAIAAALGLLLVPFLLWRLPESPNYLATRDATPLRRESRGDPATDSVAPKSGTGRLASVRLLFGTDYRRASIVFPLAGFFGFLFAYGINTWLPQLLTQGGRSQSAALAALMVANLGGLVGSFTLSRVADRYGPRPTIAVACVGGALCVVALSAGAPTALTLALVFAIGFGVLTSQAIIFAFGGGFYPPHSRATALGWFMGMSRVGGVVAPLLGGLLLGSGLGPGRTLIAFGAAALLAGLIILAVPSVSPASSRIELEEKRSASR